MACSVCGRRRIYCRACKTVHCDCSWTRGRCRVSFRLHLNDLDRDNPRKHANGRYRQRSRPYGDYLYHEDRLKFEADYIEWLSNLGDDLGEAPSVNVARDFGTAPTLLPDACPECYGRGSHLVAGDSLYGPARVSCACCDGDGLAKLPVPISKACPTCRGSGNVTNEHGVRECPLCYGDGRVYRGVS